MLIKASQGEKKINSDSCSVREYPAMSKNIGVAKAVLNGRYPDNGRAVNRECEQIYYVLSGTAKIISDKGESTIEKGDIYHFAKAEKYYVEAKLLEVLIINSPQRTPEQAEYVE